MHIWLWKTVHELVFKELVKARKLERINHQCQPKNNNPMTYIYLGSILETGRERDDAYQTMQAKVRATSLKWAGEALDPPDHVPLQALPSSWVWALQTYTPINPVVVPSLNYSRNSAKSSHGFHFIRSCPKLSSIQVQQVKKTTLRYNPHATQPIMIMW